MLYYKHPLLPLFPCFSGVCTNITEQQYELDVAHTGI